MRQAVPISVVSAVLLASTSLAFADGPKPEDSKTIVTCLEKADRPSPSTAAEERCISTVSNPCMGGSEETADAPGRKIECYDRERVVWDGILNESYKTLAAALDEDQVAKLRKMQRSWGRARDLSCGFPYDFFQGSMAYPMVSHCNNLETARRALFLRTFAADTRVK